jgi:hypothetical protein
MTLETSFGARLRCVRLGCDLTQSEFAALIRQAGEELGEPNSCTKRLVQKWEADDHATCRPHYHRALHHATGLSFAKLQAPLTEPASHLPSTQHNLQHSSTVPNRQGGSVREF